jgi:hypothetical protein
MDRGEKRPLTPGDIKQQTGLLRQHVTRGLAELEDAGLALRKAPDGGALRKGQVLLYSWAVPRQPKTEDCNRARLQFPDWFPESLEPLKPLISRFKYIITADEVTARDYKEELEAAARGYKEAEIVAVRALEKICARGQSADASLYRKNRKKDIEKEPPPPASQPIPVEAKPEPAGWPEGGGDSENKISTEVEDHLRSFPIPEPLEPETIREVAKHIDTPELLQQFKEATAPDRVKPRKWILLVQIAERTARDGPRYAKAKAASVESSPPLSRMEQRLENYRRHCQEWGKLDHG